MPTYIRVKDLANAATTPATDDFILLSGAANGARKISRADFLTAVAGFYTADPSTYKLATLDSGNKVLVSQLPSSAFSYKGTWAASTNTPTLANGTGTAGDTYYASDSGSVNFGAGSISFLAGDAVVYDGTIWQKVPDVVNLLDGKGTLDEAKTTLEIPDVGTAPNETPLNQHLGSLAYADADSVAVAELQVESTTGTATTQALTVTDGTDTNFIVQEDGKVGIGGNPSTTNPLRVSSSDATTPQALIQSNTSTGDAALSFNVSGRTFSLGIDKSDSEKFKISRSSELGNTDYVTIDGGNVGIGTASPSATVEVTDATTNVAAVRVTRRSDLTSTYAELGTTGGSGEVRSTDNLVLSADFDNNGGSSAIQFKVDGSEKWTINSSGNLVANGTAIDFGSTNSRTGVTVSASTLSHYEEGSWTPTIGTIQAGPTAGASAVYSGKYVRIGQLVYCSMDLDFDDGGTSVAVDDRFAISGLPLAVNPSLPTYTGSGSIFIYLSSGAGNNATGTVAVSSTGDSAICYITHTDGTTNWGNNLRAIFTYHTDA